jgi:type II secretory pathway predicted ATPase ExeA
MHRFEGLCKIIEDRVTVDTLVVAMFHDLSTEREVYIPGQAEKRERKLVELISKRKKPVVLLVDEAHDLKRKTLIDLAYTQHSCSWRALHEHECCV